MSEPFRADASASTRGIVYQLCVAVARCYSLKPGQKLLVEEFGDVTIPDAEQVEVKQYSDGLTDSHPNFWNSLFNWTEPTFNASQYQALVLHTTQLFSSRTKLSGWNNVGPEERLELLCEIHVDLEAEFERRNEKKACEPSPTLKQQRALITGVRRTALESILDKILIEAGAAGLTDLYHELCRVHAKHVLDSNCQRYINALLGFVCRPNKATTGERWEISYDGFKAEVETLTTTYCAESREFPRTEIDRAIETPMSEERDDLFVQKIRQIGCSNRLVVGAIRDFEGTVSTIAQEFREYTGARMRMESFRGDVERIFDLDFEKACLSPPLDEAASRRFYLTTISTSPPSFPGYADSPHSFRNGLLHVMMDDEESERAWRLRSE